MIQKFTGHCPKIFFFDSNAETLVQKNLVHIIACFIVEKFKAAKLGQKDLFTTNNKDIDASKLVMVFKVVKCYSIQRYSYLS